LNAGSTVEYTGTDVVIKNWTYDNLTISGTLSTGAQNATVEGDFTVTGTFTPSAGTMTFAGSGASLVTGDASFYDFECVTASKRLDFAANSTQTVMHTLTLNGQASGTKIDLNSATPGIQWNINASGTSNVSYVDVTDANASGSHIIATNSVGAGTMTNWSFDAAYLKITAPGAVMTAAGTLELTMTAYDAYGNVARGYTGAKNLVFSGLSNALSGDVPSTEGTNFGGAVSIVFANGASNGSSATLISYKAESASVDVTDSTINSFANASYDLDLTVNPGAIDYFTVSGILDPLTAGTSSSALVTAFDAYNNLKTDYTGTIQFTSSDAQATLPSNYAFAGDDSGTHTFTEGVILKTSGTQSVTVTGDTKTGSQSGIIVNAPPSAAVSTDVNESLTRQSMRILYVPMTLFMNMGEAGTFLSIPSIVTADHFNDSRYSSVYPAAFEANAHKETDARHGSEE
jgi:hypothetical protein